MIKYILFFILFTALFRINGQGVIEYYDNIIRGRNQIIQGDYASALNSYFLAIRHYDRPFARDCYNAVELAAITADTIKLQFSLEKPLLRRTPLSDLTNVTNLDSYFKKSFYLEIRQKGDSLNNIYTSEIKWEIRR